MRFILNAHRVLLSFDYREINWRSPKTYGVIAIVALTIWALIATFSGNQAAETSEPQKRQVKVASVSELMGGGSSLSAVAEIQSVSEAKISPEMGGRIVRIHSSLGTRVGAGQILAEIENASQRAAVLQAEGAFDAAKAALTKIQGGTRDEQLAVLDASNKSAKGSTVAALLSAYASIDSAVKDTADQMFIGVELGQIQFSVLTSNQQRESDLESRRGQLSLVLNRQAAYSKTLSVHSNLSSELDIVETEVRETRTFIDTLLAALADAIPSDSVSAEDIVAYKASATMARTALTATLSSISSAQNGLVAAEKGLELGIEGAESADVAATQAAVKQAQGAYNGALAALEKTIIRSPISGTLNNFTVKLGDTVAPSQQVAIVSNNRALEAVIFVSEDDRNRISIGQNVAVDGSTGIVTKIAPALDPVTRRIEVKIGLPNDTTLQNGQSVRVSIEKSETTQPITGPLSVPITALRMSGDRTFVFVVENGTLSARDVKIGKLTGEAVHISDGLSLDTEIVIDARGLKERDEVETIHE